MKTSPPHGTREADLLVVLDPDTTAGARQFPIRRYLPPWEPAPSCLAVLEPISRSVFGRFADLVCGRLVNRDNMSSLSGVSVRAAGH